MGCGRVVYGDGCFPGESLSPCPLPLCASHPVWYSLVNSCIQQWFTERAARVRGSEPRAADTREQKPSPSVFLLLRGGGGGPQGPSPATVTSPRHPSLCVHTASHSFKREPPSHPCGFQNRTESNLSPDLPEDSQKVKATGRPWPLCSGRYIRCSRRGPEPSTPSGSPPWKPGSASDLPQLWLEQREEVPGCGNSEPRTRRFHLGAGTCDPRAMPTSGWAEARMWRFPPRQSAHCILAPGPGPAPAAPCQLCGHTEPRGWVDQEAWLMLGIASSAGTCGKVFSGSDTHLTLLPSRSKGETPRDTPVSS